MLSNLLPFMGQVEDNRDPLKMGRVRVRAFEYHSPDPSDIPTNDLPWASIVNGTYNAAYKPPPIGSWVFGFFADGRDCQHPILLGTIASMPTEFLSPNGEYIYGAGNRACDLYQPDISRLARGEDVQATHVTARNIDAEEPVQTADGTNWETPKSAYNAEYPYNHVHETAAGHVWEMDDTPGSERVNLYHASGTHMEMDSEGNMVIGSKGSSYTVIDRNGYIYVKGSLNISTEGSINMKAGNDFNLVVDGNMNTTVHGNSSTNVAGHTDIVSGSALRMKGPSLNFEADVDNVNITASEELRLKGSAIHLKSEETFLESGDAFHILAGGSVNVDGEEVWLASGMASEALEAETTGLGAPVQQKAPVKRTPIDRTPLRIDDVDDTLA